MAPNENTDVVDATFRYALANHKSQTFRVLLLLSTSHRVRNPFDRIMFLDAEGMFVNSMRSCRIYISKI